MNCLCVCLILSVPSNLSDIARCSFFNRYVVFGCSGPGRMSYNARFIIGIGWIGFVVGLL